MAVSTWVLAPASTLRRKEEARDFYQLARDIAGLGAEPTRIRVLDLKGETKQNMRKVAAGFGYLSSGNQCEPLRVAYPRGFSI